MAQAPGSLQGPWRYCPARGAGLPCAHGPFLAGSWAARARRSSYFTGFSAPPRTGPAWAAGWSPTGTVYALDLRNHGDSPHAPTHTLADCVGDLHEWVRARARGPVRLIGHSMGGQVAMGFAAARPDLVCGDCRRGHRAAALSAGTTKRSSAPCGPTYEGCRTRAEVDALLAPLLPDSA